MNKESHTVNLLATVEEAYNQVAGNNYPVSLVEFSDSSYQVVTFENVDDRAIEFVLLEADSQEEIIAQMQIYIDENHEAFKKKLS